MNELLFLSDIAASWPSRRSSTALVLFNRENSAGILITRIRTD